MNAQVARASHLSVARDQCGETEVTVTPTQQGSSAWERAPLIDHHSLWATNFSRAPGEWRLGQTCL